MDRSTRRTHGRVSLREGVSTSSNFDEEDDLRALPCDRFNGRSTSRSSGSGTSSLLHVPRGGLYRPILEDSDDPAIGFLTRFADYEGKIHRPFLPEVPREKPEEIFTNSP
jgi:hypothetical protein